MAGFRTMLCLLLVVALSATAAVAANLTDSLKAGKADLKSAGALTFGPDGVLFVGDSMGAAIFAIDTQDNTASQAASVEVKGIADKIAAMLGTTADQILVNDVAVNPVSKKAYLSVSRGRGTTATAVIMRVDPAGKIEALSLDNVKHSKVMLPNPVNAVDGRPNQRLEAITDLAFVDSQVYVAGLSNEEFSSNLRSIPFPFVSATKGTNIEIWHGSHNRFETNSPVRTFVPYKVKQEQQILAAYTCTPLVKFPVSSLQPGAKVMGTTIAELGAGNRPLDMIVYSKGGQDFILMNNSSRGIMKLPMANLDTYKAITTSVSDTAGVPYESIAALKGVTQLDQFDGQRALILQTSDGGSLDLRTIALP